MRLVNISKETPIKSSVRGELVEPWMEDDTIK